MTVETPGSPARSGVEAGRVAGSRRGTVPLPVSGAARVLPASLAVAILLALPGIAPAQVPSSDRLDLPDAVRSALAGETPPAGDLLPAPSPLPVALQDGPIDPAAYRLGPGDELTIHYRGRTSVTYRLLVTPEGDLYLPDVGPVALAGRSLDEGRRLIKAAAARILKAVTVDVQLTGLRTFKISVGGEVWKPGVYPATAVTRVYEILRQAGGMKDSAAVRDVRLIGGMAAASAGAARGGAGVAGAASDPAIHVDLLPYILQGRMEGSNPYVRDGQSVFVPRRSRSVGVHGAVLHPGTYDLPDSAATLGGLLDLVGLSPDAAPDRMELLVAARSSPGIAPDGGVEAGPDRPVVIVVADPLKTEPGRPLADGDQVLVPHQSGYGRADLVTVTGEVRFPGTYPLAGSPGSESAPKTLRDLIETAGGFTRLALPSRVRLARPMPADTLSAELRRLSMFNTVQLTATERELLRARGVSRYRAVVVDVPRRWDAGSDSGPQLFPGDQIFVPRSSGYVEVAGRVKTPGFYEWSSGLGAGDYVAVAGGFADRADRKGVRVGAGPGGDFALARDATPPQPGDLVWVPEKTPRPKLETVKDIMVILGQIATVFIVIDQAVTN